MLDYDNPRKQGDAGMGMAIGWFASKGYTVCVPLTDSQDYDLVVEINEMLKKVQVRTTKRKSKHGIYELNMKVCGGNRSGTGKIKLFDKSTVDFVFALTKEGEMYLIPSNEIHVKSMLSLGKLVERFKVTPS